MEIKQLNIKKIVPYANNAKEHPQWHIDQIKSSIGAFGFNDPITVDEKNVIMAGHGRFTAMEQLGYEEVPVIVLKHLNEGQKKQYILAHNKLTMNTGFNIELLKLEIESINLEVGDLDLIGFDADELKDLGFDLDLGVGEPWDFKEKEKVLGTDDLKEPYSKIGDMWVLGKHRLLCGDSTIEEDIIKLMDGKKANLVFADPPYGMKKETDGVTNDNLNFKDLLEFNKKWIPHTFKNSTKVASWYCWGTDEPLMDIYSEILKPMINNQECTFRNLLTWNKGNGQGQSSSKTRSYANADEKCLFVMKGVQGFNDNANNYYEGWEPIRTYLYDEKEKLGLTYEQIGITCGVTSRMVLHWMTKSQFEFISKKYYKLLQKNYKGFGKEYKILKKEYEEVKKEFLSTRSYFDNTHDNMNNIWAIERTPNSERVGHATPKPLKLCERVIKSSSREGEIILDPFGGGGSTLMAAERLNRTAYLNEIEPKWVDVIVKRYNDLEKDGIKLVRDGKEYKWESIKDKFLKD